MESLTEKNIQKDIEDIFDINNMKQQMDELCMLVAKLSLQLEVIKQKCKEKMLSYYDSGFEAAYEDIDSDMNDMYIRGYWDGFKRNEPHIEHEQKIFDISTLYSSEKTENENLKEKIFKLEEDNKYLKLSLDILTQTNKNN